MLKYEFERIEDFRRAVKDAKITRIFYRVEYARPAENSFSADMRLTAITTQLNGEKEHFTLTERIASVTITPQGQAQEKAAFEEAIALKKNSFGDMMRDTMPDVRAVVGVIYP
jgi:hypothetical protein